MKSAKIFVLWILFKSRRCKRRRLKSFVNNVSRKKKNLKMKYFGTSKMMDGMKITMQLVTIKTKGSNANL